MKCYIHLAYEKIPTPLKSMYTMHEADNAYSILRSWLCYRLFRVVTLAYSGNIIFWICRLSIYILLQNKRGVTSRKLLIKSRNQNIFEKLKLDRNLQRIPFKMMYNMSVLRHRFSNKRWGGGGGGAEPPSSLIL